jgi:tetratricopeptide (TPR) repeat protein
MEHKLDLNRCEYYAKRGDYEEAVACYQERQKLDPSNDFIRQKIEEIIKTCKRENEILQLDLKCEPKPGAHPSTINPPQ